MIEPVVFNSKLGTVDLIDQTKLPLENVVIHCDNHLVIARAIREMQVRGAPAIGVAAAFGVYLGVKNFSGHADTFPPFLELIYKDLSATRPTAVNLFWAIERMRKKLAQVISQTNSQSLHQALLEEALAEAQAIRSEDVAMCQAIGRFGASFLNEGDTWITHCNAGALATAGFGTALGVFRAAKEAGKTFSVFVDETRPLLQGARLTAWELLEEGISTTLICDNMAGSLMAYGQVQGVVVGADRITAHGFVANKIGTYPLAVLAHYHNIPFYVAAPTSTFDLSIQHGSQIHIEERNACEVTQCRGVTLAPPKVKVRNPSFDVTPPKLVTAIFTNLGVLTPPFEESIKRSIPAGSLP